MTASPPLYRGLGGAMVRRQLHFVYILDTSGSMNADGKIQALNIAIAESLPLLRSAAQDNVAAEVMVRAVTFSDGARWVTPDATPVDRFRWVPVAASGLTDLGAALELVAAAMASPPMPERALPPVLVLVSDGRPTDDYGAGLGALGATAWGRRAVRLAVAIGANVDRGVLQEFIGHGTPYTPMDADDPESLIEAIRWATTAATRIAAGAAPLPMEDDDVFVLAEEDA